MGLSSSASLPRTASSSDSTFRGDHAGVAPSSIKRQTLPTGSSFGHEEPAGACAIIEHDGKSGCQRSERMSLPSSGSFPAERSTNRKPRKHVFCVRSWKSSVSRDVGMPCEGEPCLYDFSVTLYPFICTIAGGALTLHEHKRSGAAARGLLSLDGLCGPSDHHGIPWLMRTK